MIANVQGNAISKIWTPLSFYNFTDPRSINYTNAPSGLIDQGSVAGSRYSGCLLIILPTFAGVGPIKIYSFVSAINLQMRQIILYNPIDIVCQVLYKINMRKLKNKLIDIWIVIAWIMLLPLILIFKLMERKK